MSQSSSEVYEGFFLRGNKGHYYVEKFLGEGTYGKVVKCLEMSTQKHVAIKMINKDFEDAYEDEIKALIELSQIDADKYNLVKFVEWFHHKNHVCIVLEMLDISLLDYMKKRGSRPLSLRTIRSLAWQLLVALRALKKINMVHCDIKLDNIMLVDQNAEPLRLKLIDFGLAEKVEDLVMGNRIQNICFRAPEVMLGLPLDERLDMWTAGYVLALLYTGFCIHPQDSEYNIIRTMWKLDTPEEQSNKNGMWVADKLDFWSFDELIRRYPNKKKAKKVEEFMDLLKRMLEVDPNKRISPDEALQHPLFNLWKKQPQTPKEPPQVHQQPEAKAPAVSRKRKRSDEQSQEPETKAPAQVHLQPEETPQAVSKKRKRSDQQSQEPETEAPAPQVHQHPEAKAPALSRKRKRSDQQSQEPETEAPASQVHQEPEEMAQPVSKKRKHSNQQSQKPETEAPASQVHQEPEAKAPAVSRKRKRSDQQSQEPETEAPAPQVHQEPEAKAPAVSRKRKRSDQQSQEPNELSKRDTSSEEKEILENYFFYTVWN
uniref:Protein kinase domain-containing protein n=1 Tax=Oryzias melastigma TaxID=30732 RepID=A0A3B3DVI9_ORYME